MLALTPLSARAMTPASSAAGVPPRSPAAVLSGPSEEGLGLSVLTRWSARSTLRSGTRRVANPSGERTVSRRTSLALDYRVRPRAVLLLSIPHVYHRSTSQSFDQTTDGLGDVVFLGRYAALRDRAIRTEREVSAVAGVKFPTGSVQARDSAGARLSAPQQPGSGTTDFIVGAAAYAIRIPFTAYGDVSYKLNTRAAYTFGNLLAVNAGVGCSVPGAPRLSLSGEVNGEFAARDRSIEKGAAGLLPNGDVDSTGGETVYLTPALQWRPFHALALSLSVQIPVHQNLRGTQLQSGLNYDLGLRARL